MLESLEPFKFLIVGLNLVILYFILKKILFKPVTEFMEKRTKSIKDALDSSEKAKLEAIEIKQQYELKLRAAKDEADSIINASNVRANKEYDSLLATAKQDAQGVMTKAREEIERERAQMLKDIKNQVASLALAAATKIIEVNMDTATNRALVDKFIDEEGAA
jgi:F-type H+-transporting ATPase subunit b